MNGNDTFGTPERGSTVSRANNKRLGCFCGNRLRQLRRNKGLSRKELAKRADVSVQTIARLELHNAVGRTDKLARLARELKVPCGYLLGEDGLKLSEFGVTGELKNKVVTFLNRLMRAQDPARLVDALCVFIDSKAEDIGREEITISQEEEVLGLWWSIVSAYSRGDWRTMTIKSETLVNLAEMLGRPFLVAIAHAYKAKAIRNSGGRNAVERAEKEIKELLEGKQYQSALTCRLISKVYSRKQETQKAMDECKKAEMLMKESNRDDALFLLERVKLMRNLATRNLDLAQRAKEDDKESLLARYLKEADTYIRLCEGANENLEKQLEKEAHIERMLLALCRARYQEVNEHLDSAVRSAEEALGLADKLGEKNYAVRVRMFLCHIYVERGQKNKAIHYYGTLFPLQKYSSGRFRWYYRRYIRGHQEILRQYMKEQCAYLNHESGYGEKI